MRCGTAPSVGGKGAPHSPFFIPCQLNSCCCFSLVSSPLLRTPCPPCVGYGRRCVAHLLHRVYRLCYRAYMVHISVAGKRRPVPAPIRPIQSRKDRRHYPL